MTHRCTENVLLNRAAVPCMCVSSGSICWLPGSKPHICCSPVTLLGCLEHGRILSLAHESLSVTNCGKRMHWNHTHMNILSNAQNTSSQLAIRNLSQRLLVLCIWHVCTCFCSVYVVCMCVHVCICACLCVYVSGMCVCAYEHRTTSVSFLTFYHVWCRICVIHCLEATWPLSFDKFSCLLLLSQRVQRDCRHSTNLVLCWFWGFELRSSGFMLF